MIKSKNVRRDMRFLIYRSRQSGESDFKLTGTFIIIAIPF